VNTPLRTVERFFRVEPARYMTKAQLTTALRRSFGDSVIKSDGAIGKLFQSFDFNRTDEMDWRAFLYMLAILMQPYLYCHDLLR
jgi:Ca2+-binding EF-hand superfamily protein